MIRTLALALGALVLVGCVNGGKGPEVRSTYEPSLNQPSRVVEEDEYLDIGVVVFDPGLDTVTDEELVFPEIRRAEGTFIANHLSDTLSNVRAWGAVRVVPSASQFTDLLVSGQILRSDGLWLKLAVSVEDSTGQKWLNRTYEQKVGENSYDPKMLNVGDPFQKVYDSIANDMLEVFDSKQREELLRVRDVAELRFARAFAEDAFADYLQQNKDGEYQLRRLPAKNDPMLERVKNLRSRNYVFIDTLQPHYVGFSEDMYEPYLEWRKRSRNDVEAEEKLKKEAKQQMWVGAAAIVAGVAASTSSNANTSAAGAVGVIGGGAELLKGVRTRQESKMHSLAVEELGQSLQAEITPRVIELEDRTVRLSGSAEDQYSQWRELMADLYAAEMGELQMGEAQTNGNSADDLTSTGSVQTKTDGSADGLNSGQ